MKQKAPEAQERPPVAPGSTEAQKPTTDTPDARRGQENAIYRVVLGLMSEKRFQAVIVSSLKQRGFTVWTVPNMRQTTAGLPDILAAREGWPYLLAWEIKTLIGRATAKQKAALAALGAVPGVDARIVRPDDWEALRDWIDSAVIGPAPSRAEGTGR